MTREKQIDWLCRLKSEIKIFMPYQWQKPFQEALDMAIKTPEQEPKIGHWNEIPKYENIAWLCSECGHFTTMKHNYCPNCGCHMVEPQESEG